MSPYIDVPPLHTTVTTTIGFAAVADWFAKMGSREQVAVLAAIVSRVHAVCRDNDSYGEAQWAMIGEAMADEEFDRTEIENVRNAFRWLFPEAEPRRPLPSDRRVLSDD